MTRIRTRLKLENFNRIFIEKIRKFLSSSEYELFTRKIKKIESDRVAYSNSKIFNIELELATRTCTRSKLET
jgi:hypothetical protein